MATPIQTGRNRSSRDSCPRTDPSNADTGLTRNAVRRKVIPALERGVGRDVSATVARTGRNLQRDAAYLQMLAAAHSEDLYEEEEDGFAFPAVALAALPAAMSTRVVRAAFYRLGVPPTSEHIDAVLDLAAGRPGRSRDLREGLLATRDREYVRVSRSRSPG